MDIVIFGAGIRGKEAYRHYTRRGDNVKYFIDNNQSLYGKRVKDIAIIPLSEYLQKEMTDMIVIAGTYHSIIAIEKQLKENGVTKYIRYSPVYEKERLFSYCPERELEDVVLYHLLKNEPEIFFIDVGASDPVWGNVTYLLRGKKGARGINIEPREGMYRLSCIERQDDINLRLGVGKCDAEEKIYIQDGGSTLHNEFVVLDNCDTETITITTLEKVCKQYVDGDKRISLLKIDVEGAEKDVLLGADFKLWRPEIICIESTLPRTEIPSYDDWEEILIEAGYEFMYMCGINRYYVAREAKGKYQQTFSELDDLKEIYDIYLMKMDVVL